jgi:hypothetical protein
MATMTVKEQKAILKIFSGTDVNAVKKYLDNGFNPNDIFTLKYGNMYGPNDPYTMYDVALHVQM